MKILFLGGDHPRHRYVLKTLNDTVGVDLAVLERRGSMIPELPEGLSEKDEMLWDKHFLGRNFAEWKYFGTELYVESELVEDINTEWMFTNEFQHCDLCIVFGCGLIQPGLAILLPHHTINMHLGLSPRYRGAATLFWPFYFLEPQFAGVTFHYIVQEPDAGDIVHQCRPELVRGDGIHDTACKAVVRATDDLLKLVDKFPEWSTHKQKSTGKNFLSTDFRPQHLRMIYDVYDNDIVDRYLDGELLGREPWLFEENLK